MLDTMSGIGSVVEARRAFCTVSTHCLESIVRLAQQTDVVTTCDIVDDGGNRLLDRGATLSRSIQPALLRRRLQTPLEACLDVAQGASLPSIVDDALALLDATPALALLGAASGARQALRAVATMPLPGPLSLLLTIARGLAQGSYENSLAAMIVCAGLAHRLGLSEHDSGLLVLAALVQDIGESYIDPGLLDGSGPLPVQQWQNVAAHPLLGHAFLSAFTDYPPELADGVLQHHERQDGSGYPLQRGAATMTPLGTLIGLADCVAAVVMGSAATGREAHPDAESYASLGARVAIALTIVPGEFPRDAVAFVSAALAPLGERGSGIAGGSFAQRILPTLQQIRSARLLADALSHSAATPGLARCGEFALAAIRILDKRLRTTGVYDIAQLGVLESDAQQMGRTCLVLDEVRWRLRHLARNIYLRTEQRSAGKDLAQVAELVAVLSAPA